jgi:hypothetical protein
MHGVASAGLNAGHRGQRDGELDAIVLIIQQFDAE